MQATTAQAHSQRASRVIAALHFVTTTFVMRAMVGRRSHQIKMPRQAAYLGVVWRVDEDAFHTTTIKRQQRLQGIEVVAVDQQIAA